ncbi:MAG TPA: hypothetical protein VLG38_01200 [Gammaproteobacteria bacterium]|nr:hypothetical protein [Gammaproteobacteria bacterium]
MPTLEKTIYTACASGDTDKLHDLLNGAYQNDIVHSAHYYWPNDPQYNPERKRVALYFAVTALEAAIKHGQLAVVQMLCENNEVAEIFSVASGNSIYIKIYYIAAECEQFAIMDYVQHRVHNYAQKETLRKAIDKKQIKLIEYFMQNSEHRRQYYYSLSDNVDIAKAVDTVKGIANPKTYALAVDHMHRWILSSSTNINISSIPNITAIYMQYADFLIASSNALRALDNRDLETLDINLRNAQTHAYGSPKFDRFLSGLFSKAVASRNIEVIMLLLKCKSLTASQNDINTMLASCTENSLLTMPLIDLLLQVVVTQPQGYDLSSHFTTAINVKYWPMLEKVVAACNGPNNTWFLQAMHAALSTGHITLLKSLAKINSDDANPTVLTFDGADVLHPLNNDYTSPLMIYSLLNFPDVNSIFARVTNMSRRYQKIVDCHKALRIAEDQQELIAQLSNHNLHISFAILMFLLSKAPIPERNKYIQALRHILLSENVLKTVNMMNAIAHLVTDRHFTWVMDALPQAEGQLPEVVQKAICGEYRENVNFEHLILEMCTELTNNKSSPRKVIAMALEYALNINEMGVGIFTKYPDLVQVIAPFLKGDALSSLVEGIVHGIIDPQQRLILIDALMKLYDASMPDNFMNPGLIRFIGIQRFTFDPAQFPEQRQAIDKWIQDKPDAWEPRHDFREFRMS